MQPPPEFYGPMLRAIRKHRGLTQAKIAERVGLGDDTIRRYENGWCMPDPLTILKLARALDVDTINFYQADPVRKFARGKRIHVGVDEESSLPQLDSSLRKRLSYLPQVLAGERVRFSFRNETHHVDQHWRGWKELDATTAKWLGLAPGATIHCRLLLLTQDNPDGIGTYTVYATGDKAATLFDLANAAKVDVVGEWAYAVGPDWRRSSWDDEDNKEYEVHEGFVVAEIISF